MYLRLVSPFVSKWRLRLCVLQRDGQTVQGSGRRGTASRRWPPACLCPSGGKQLSSSGYRDLRPADSCRNCDSAQPGGELTVTCRKDLAARHSDWRSEFAFGRSLVHILRGPTLIILNEVFVVLLSPFRQFALQCFELRHRRLLPCPLQLITDCFSYRVVLCNVNY
jgi:hypothetical protein